MTIQTTVRRIDADTWQFSEQGPGSAVYQYLLAGNERAMLIDTGMYNSDFPALMEGLTDKPAFVVNTHGHLDHISGNHRFGTAWLHPQDAEVFRLHSDAGARRAFLMAVAREMGLDESSFAPEFLDRVLNLPQVDNRQGLADGQRFDLGGRSVQVIHTPGHSLGSVCLLDEGRRQLYTGDTVCDLGVLLHLPGAAPLAVFRDSLARLLSLAGRYDAIWPGHHTCPLQADIIGRYLACADKARAGEPGIETPDGATGRARVVSHEGIRISLPIG